MRQGDTLEAALDFGFRTPAGRTVIVSSGDLFWVTATHTTHPSIVPEGEVLVARNGRGVIGHGWRFRSKDIYDHFRVCKS